MLRIRDNRVKKSLDYLPRRLNIPMRHCDQLVTSSVMPSNEDHGKSANFHERWGSSELRREGGTGWEARPTEIYLPAGVEVELCWTWVSQ
jgi:hypothetical protein